MGELRRASLVLLLICPPIFHLHAQSAPRLDNTSSDYSRKNSFGIFAEYSNNSSHILLGRARNRSFATLGATYTHRLLLRPALDMQYMAEIRPVLMESDPVTHVTQTYLGLPADQTLSYSEVFASKCPVRSATIEGIQTGGPYQGSPYTLNFTYACSRQWTYGQGFSPVGLKFNLRPRHRLQPVFTITGGYMFSTRPIPIANAGSYNFTFALGAGLELYSQRDDSRSLFGHRALRAEYRYQHVSNGWTATENPGIDSGILQVAFTFGR